MVMKSSCKRGDEVVPQQAEVDDDRPQRQHDRRQQHRVDVRPEVLGQRHVGGRAREDVPVHGEDEHEHRRDDERAGAPAWRTCVLFDAWSKSLLGRRAACIAIGKAMAKAMICEKMISSRSIGNDCAMMLVVVWCVVNDWPRLPWKTWPIQMKYCCQSGLSRPSWWLTVATFCGVALGPRMVIGGVAREQMDQEERRDGDEDDDDDEQHESLGDVTAHVCLLPPFAVLGSLAGRGPPRRRMILDLGPLVLPCGPCLRRFPLSPVARASSSVSAWRSSWPPGWCSASGPARASGSTRRSPSTSPACPCTPSPSALKHDGAPPLYYYLLHFWISLFGQSNDAVRALSGIFAVLTLPGRLALREALRRPGRGLDHAGAAGQRALRRLLRHRVADVRAGHPADRLGFLALDGPSTRPGRAT